MNTTDSEKLKDSRLHAGIGGRYRGPHKLLSLRRGEPGHYGSSTAGIPSSTAPPQPYPPAAGRDDLRELLTFDIKRSLRLDVARDRVLITNGAAHALFVALLFLRLRSRLRVLLVTPTWKGVPANQIRLLGGTVRELPMTFGRTNIWNLDLNALDRSLVDVDACFVVHPGNPVGVRLPCLREVIKMLAAHRVMGLLDLTYDAMSHDRQSLDLGFLAGLPDVFLLRSFSKQFGVPGFRIGSLIVPHDAAPACEQIVQQTTMGVGTLSQEWAAQTLRHHLETNGTWFDPVIREMVRRSAFVCAALGRAGFRFQPPDAGYYLFARLPDYIRRPATRFASALYESRGVEVLPGDDFGDDFGDFIRMSISNPPIFDDLTDAVGRIVDFAHEEMGPVIPARAAAQAALYRA